MVGQTLASKLVALGHEVTMGSREAGNEKAVEWVKRAGAGASEGSFAQAAAAGELVLNATAGAASLDALWAAEATNLNGKILIDVANPLDFSAGFPPTLSVCNTDSLGEKIQNDFPEVRVVKALNTVNADVMVNPGIVPGSHTVFICGNDGSAKREVVALLETFGWPGGDIVDLGGIDAARGTEMYLALWLRLMGVAGTPHLNVKLIVG
jgi:predicted dinucleotide-binding enzyme